MNDICVYLIDKEGVYHPVDIKSTLDVKLRYGILDLATGIDSFSSQAYDITLVGTNRTLQAVQNIHRVDSLSSSTLYSGQEFRAAVVAKGQNILRGGGILSVGEESANVQDNCLEWDAIITGERYNWISRFLETPLCDLDLGTIPASSSEDIEETILRSWDRWGSLASGLSAQARANNPEGITEHPDSIDYNLNPWAGTWSWYRDEANNRGGFVFLPVHFGRWEVQRLGDPEYPTATFIEANTGIEEDERLRVPLPSQFFVRPTDLSLWVYIKHIVLAAFNQLTSFSLKSRFFNTQFFEGLIMYYDNNLNPNYNGELGFLATGQLSATITPTPLTTLAPTFGVPIHVDNTFTLTENGEISSDFVPFDTQSVFNLNDSSFTISTPTIGDLNFLVTMGLDGSGIPFDNANITVNLQRAENYPTIDPANDTIIASQSRSVVSGTNEFLRFTLAFGFGGEFYHYEDSFRMIALDAGTYYLSVEFETFIGATAFPPATAIDGFVGRNASFEYLGFRSKEFPIASNIDNSIGGTFNCDLTIRDVIVGITQMFNLVWETDVENNCIRVEPFDDFYRERFEEIDITEKVNCGTEVNTDELSKDSGLELSYKNDSDDAIVDQVSERRVGSLLYDETYTYTTNEDEDKEERINETFAPTYYIKDENVKVIGEGRLRIQGSISVADGPEGLIGGPNTNTLFTSLEDICTNGTQTTIEALATPDGDVFLDQDSKRFTFILNAGVTGEVGFFYNVLCDGVVSHNGFRKVFQVPNFTNRVGDLQAPHWLRAWEETNDKESDDIYYSLFLQKDAKKSWLPRIAYYSGVRHYPADNVPDAQFGFRYQPNGVGNFVR
ncbi:MAG: hypothetical protein AAF378_10675, partial [Cyanobacteria bacterium P01_A01_bin.84]